MLISPFIYHFDYLIRYLTEMFVIAIVLEFNPFIVLLIKMVFFLNPNICMYMKPGQAIQIYKVLDWNELFVWLFNSSPCWIVGRPKSHNIYLIDRLLIMIVRVFILPHCHNATMKFYCFKMCSFMNN